LSDLLGEIRTPDLQIRKWGAPVADLIAPGIDDAEDHAANALTPYFSW
jgi:hypothetical protein